MLFISNVQDTLNVVADGNCTVCGVEPVILWIRGDAFVNTMGVALDTVVNDADMKLVAKDAPCEGMNFNVLSDTFIGKNPVLAETHAG